MNEGNRQRVKRLAEHFMSLAKENPDADTVMFAMLKAQRMMLDIMDDVHFRPGANE